MSTPFDPNGQYGRNDHPRARHAPQTLTAVRSLRARLVANALLSVAVLVLLSAFTAVVVDIRGLDSDVLWSAGVGYALVVVVFAVCAQAAFKAANTQLVADLRAATRRAEEQAAEQSDRRDGELQELFSLLDKMPGEIAGTVGGSLAATLTQLRRDLAAARPVHDFLPGVAPELDLAVQQALGSIMAQWAEDAERQWKEVVVSLTRRLQPLIRKAIASIDAMENDVEDGDLLRGLFRIDNGLGRTRRRIESILMLLGASVQRSTTPRHVYEVLQSAVSMIEHYKRVELPLRVHGELVGSAAQEVTLLFAELLENAATFSAPETKVFVTARAVRDALYIEIKDSGLAIPGDILEHLQRLLGADQLKVSDLVQGDGRTGLSVVAVVARRYKILVKLTTSDAGNRAVVVLPLSLLVAPPHEASSGTASALSPAVAPIARPAQSEPRDGGESARPSGPTHSAYSVPAEGYLPRRTTAPTPTPGMHEGQPVSLSSSAGTSEPGAQDRPQLPRRNGGGVHMAPGLRQARAVPRRQADETGGFDPRLMAVFKEGQTPSSHHPGRAVTDASGASPFPYEENDA